MNTSKVHNKVLDIIWIIIWVVLIASFYMHSAISKGWNCIEKALEMVEYYQVFFWPEIVGSLGVCMMIIVATIFGVWIFFRLDSNTDVYGRKTIMTNNMLYISTVAVLVAYILLSIFGLKAYSLWLILYGIIIIVAIVSICINNRAYSMLDDDIEDEAEKSEVEENAWRSVSSKISIIFGVTLFTVFFLCIDYHEESKQAEHWHKEVNADRVDVCYEHVIGTETNLAIVKVEFVNLFGESGRQYSIEELDKEYLNYMNGTGSWSTLWQFCQDSVAIELDNQRYIDDYEPWCYGGYTGLEYDCEMVIYELGERPKGHEAEEEEMEYNAKVDDKFRDLIYFGTCVEEKLMEKDLTLSQRGDRYSYDRTDYVLEYGVLGVDVCSASKEQVYEACQEVANEIENEPVYVNKIDVEMQVEVGKPLSEAVVTELNGYDIKGVAWKTYAGIGFQGRQDWTSKDLALEAGQEYKAIISVKIPMGYYFEPDTEISVAGIDYGKLELAKDNNVNGNVWKIEVSFKIDD